MLVIGSQCVNKQSYDLVYHLKTLFPTQLLSQWLKNLVKVRSFRLQQCFNQFLIFSVEGSSKTRLFRHLSNDVFWSPWLRKYISYEGHPFFGKCVKIDIDLKNAKKNKKKKLRKSFFIGSHCVNKQSYDFAYH